MLRSGRNLIEAASMFNRPFTLRGFRELETSLRGGDVYMRQRKVIMGSGYGLSPVWCQAITQTKPNFCQSDFGEEIAMKI